MGSDTETGGETVKPFGWIDTMIVVFLFGATWHVADRSLTVLADTPELPEWASMTCDDLTAVRYHDGDVTFTIGARDE